jgi:hypothetical protein
VLFPLFKKLENKLNLRKEANQVLAIGRLGSGDRGLSPDWAKKFVRPHLDGKKLGMAAGIYHPSNGRKHKIGGLCPSRPGQKSKTLSPN